jgi:hypothetical protein
MSTAELRKKLIEKINETKDENLLEVAYRLLESEAEDSEIYKLSSEQKNVVHESQEQIKKGDFLSNEQSDKEIDEWLNK